MVSYTTRETVVGALGDISPTARGTALVDAAIESASRSVEALCHRTFYPWSGTRYFEVDGGWWAENRLWLNQNDLISVTAITVDGTVAAPADWQLFPGDGPPYTSVGFPSGPSLPVQGRTAVTGVFGYGNDQAPAGTAAEAMDAVETGMDVSNAALIGVGDVLTIDTERMIVTDRTWITTAQTVQTPLTASAANTTVAVTTGSAYAAGEMLLLDSERVLITDIAGNNLTVRRAQDGTVLAVHTGSTIYAARTLTVVRGALGTTAATHLTAAPLTRLLVPALVRALATAEAVNEVQLQAGGYAASTGSSDAETVQSSKGLADLRARCLAGFGRKARMRSI